MKKWMLIARINNHRYLTSVDAETAYSAEHLVLDHGICGKHGYGVDDCMAFDEDTMRGDTFINMALNSIAVSWIELCDLIDKNNSRIRELDAAERRIEEINVEIKLLRDEQVRCMAILNQ